MHLKNYLKKFKTTPFDYINGYTSPIVQFAKFLKRKNLVLKTICPTLKACIVTSEMLFESDKKLLERQFGVPVINEYGASELDLIAFQNLKNEWQINSETLFVEILDENNKSYQMAKKVELLLHLFTTKHILLFDMILEILEYFQKKVLLKSQF